MSRKGGCASSGALCPKAPMGSGERRVTRGACMPGRSAGPWSRGAHTPSWAWPLPLPRCRLTTMRRFWAATASPGAGILDGENCIIRIRALRLPSTQPDLRVNS
ncbi:hypothetical protein LEMLEM_LOCUS12933 [Lemmus lemmus]